MSERKLSIQKVKDERRSSHLSLVGGVESGRRSDEFTHLPLVVDLNGAVVRCNIEQEQVAQAFVQNALLTINSLRKTVCSSNPLGLLLCEHSEFDSSALPFRPELLEYLRIQKKQGRVIHLISTASVNVVERIAGEVGLFAGWTGSTATRNISKTNKKEIIVEMFPDGFAYAGNGVGDIEIWEDADSMLLIGASEHIGAKAFALDTPLELRLNDRPTGSLWLKALRVHQWSKNTLLFVPILLSPAITSSSAWIFAMLGFFALCAAASGNYLLNDILI